MIKLPEEKDRLLIILGYAFGFSTLIVYGVLALVIAIGHIEEKTSYGLPIVLGAMGPLGGAFVGWAFGKGDK